jgi:hypothetical protein
MSHFTTIDVRITDIDAVRAACAELGVGLEAGAEARGFGGSRTRGDFVIRLAGPYDAALLRQPDGAYVLSADLWQGHVERELGAGFGRLRQLYGVHKTVIEARRRGLTVRRTAAAGGAVRLVLCGRAGRRSARPALPNRTAPQPGGQP